MATKNYKSYKQLSDQEFKTIKALQDAGLSTGKVANITGRASSTVGRVFKAKNPAHYKELLAKLHPPKDVPKPTGGGYGA